ncbi:MAG: hypothetical protein ABIY55_28270 [Kofleriaceae bacterium]
MATTQGRPSSRASDRLPRSVRIKTPTRTFNLFFYFALDDDGRIWVKSIPGASPRTDAVAPDWRLFLGTGLPHGESRTSFVAPARIASINADLDELMAVSDTNRLYSLRWFDNPVFKEDVPAGMWADEHGWPVHGPLVWDAHVEHNRGWAIGRRTRSFVLFEDIAGRTFDGGGGLSTYYVLSEAGTSIAFSDSGLPPDFSHTIGGPDRSTFIAETMQVSADTIFVINAYGELRTRMVDFDTDGSDTMFFVYSYDRRDPRPDAIAIPAEDWFAHKPIPLQRLAQISTQLAIVLTGKHNRDRELRVAGYDEDRLPGFYFKRIFDQVLGSPHREDHHEWQFAHDDSIALDSDCLLDPADTDPSVDRAATRAAVPTRWQTKARPERRAAARDMLFTGALWLNGERTDIRVQALDFHLDWSPTRLRFSSGAESIDVTLHTAEKWYHLLRFDPGHDGTPKELQGTLELSTEAFTTSDPILRALVADVLAHYHLVAFAWFVQATEDYLQIETKPARKAGLAGLRVVLELVRSGRDYASYAGARRTSLQQDKFTTAARAPALGIGKPIAELTRADASALRDKISHNLQTAATLVTAAAAPIRQDAATPSWLRPSVLGALRYAARPWLIGIVLPLLPFRNISTTEAAYYAKNLATNLPLLLARSRELRDHLLACARLDLAHALMLIDTRIAAYTRRLAQLAGTTTDQPFSYFEDLAGFWRPLRFGSARLDQMPWRAAPGTCAASVRDDELFVQPTAIAGARRPSPPGIVIDVASHGSAGLGEPGNMVALRITPTHLERDFFHASIRTPDPVGSATNPFRTAVEVQVDRADTTPSAQVVLDSIFRTPVRARSQHAPAELSVEAGRYRVTGEGFLLAWHVGT